VTKIPIQLPTGTIFGAGTGIVYATMPRDLPPRCTLTVTSDRRAELSITALYLDRENLLAADAEFCPVIPIEIPLPIRQGQRIELCLRRVRADAPKFEPTTFDVRLEEP
jgi:hypothetical protein